MLTPHKTDQTHRPAPRIPLPRGRRLSIAPLSIIIASLVPAAMVFAFFNNPADAQEVSGLPVITGTARVGHTLASDGNGSSDAQGIPEHSVFGYQWYRVAGDTITYIDGATRSIHTLTDADLGRQLKVTYTFGDAAGNSETRVSELFPYQNFVAKECDRARAHENWCPIVTIGSTGSRYGYISATNSTGQVGAITDTDFTFNSDVHTVEALYVAPDGTMAINITPPPNFGPFDQLQVGQHSFPFSISTRIGNQFFFAKTGLSWSPGETVPVKILTAPPNEPLTGKPAISGQARQSQTLHADVTGLSDPNGIPAVVGYSGSRIKQNNIGPIRGATSSTYTLTADDVGAKVRVFVFYQDLDGFYETVTSAAYPASGTITHETHTVRIESVTFSDPGGDNLYTDGEFLDITVSLSNPTTVGPESAIYGTRSSTNADGVNCLHKNSTGAIADYHSGSGTDTIVFRCIIDNAPATRVLVEASTIFLTGTGNDTFYRQHPEYSRSTSLHGTTGPTITSIAAHAHTGDGQWDAGDTINVDVTFSENITVDASLNIPELIVHEYADGVFRHQGYYPYAGETSGATMTFERSLSPLTYAHDAVAIPANALLHNNAVITSAATGAPANVGNTAYARHPATASTPE